ncbi:MAG TPA: CmcJ/NvfI family oxidoreductase [Gammaproteobacteria bacterium]|nr:CmcJ/NvfI family oxidoreductase [Gammaproteobacteria bacterium]
MGFGYTDVVTNNTQARSVEADIGYLAPGSHINRRFVAPGKEVNTGTYESYRVQIRDARPLQEQFTLDTHGFVLAEHRSTVGDFFDSEEVDAVYPGEVDDIVRELTGADHVVQRGWMVRTSGDLGKHRHKVQGYTHRSGVQPPASEAHVDYMPERAEAMAASIYKESFPDEKPYSRFIASSLWRTFSEPPQDWPLALCDASSVGADEGTPNALIIVDEIPDRDTMLADEWEEKTVVTAAIFPYKPQHRWWYFSNMTRHEVVLLKFHDSDKSRAMRVPHTAFRDTSFADVKPRSSIEVRTFAYFL